MRVSGIYGSPSRPADTEFFHKLENSLIRDQNEMLVVTGNFNIDLQKFLSFKLLTRTAGHLTKLRV